MSIKGMEQLIENLNNISETAVKRASSQAVNRVAARAASKAISRVAKQTHVPRKLIKQRVKIKNATARKPQARIQVNRGNLPAIKLGIASVRLSRRKRDKSGTRSVLQIGPFRFPGAFIQQLANGRWHVLRRTTRDRKPIEVVSIKLTEPLTAAFHDEIDRQMTQNMPREMREALKRQIRLQIKRLR